MKKTSLLKIMLLCVLVFSVFVACEEIAEQPSQEGEEGQGRETVLPVYMGSKQMAFAELSPTVFNTIYYVPASVEQVVYFYGQEIGDIEGVSQSNETPGEGVYHFEFQGGPLEGYPEQNSSFFITLFDDEGTGETEIQIMATYDFFE